MRSVQRKTTTKLLYFLVVASLLMNTTPVVVRAAPPQGAPVEAATALAQDPEPPEGEAPLPDPGAEEPPPWEEGQSDFSHEVFLPLVARNHGPEAQAVLQGQVEPWLALPGDAVTFMLTLTSTGELALRDGLLASRVPEQVQVLDLGGAVYNSSARELRWTLGRLEPGQVAMRVFQVRVAQGAEMTVVESRATFEAQAVSETARPGATAAVTTTLLVGEAVAGTLTPEGGELASPDGRVRLEAPAGTVTRTTNVRVADFPLPAWSWNAEDPRWLALFDVRAEGEAGRALVGADGHVRFLQPLTVTVALTDRVGWMDAYLLHCGDPACEVQEPMPAEFDRETKVLTATLQTFSGAGAAALNPFPTDGSHFLFQGWPGTDLYSGGLNYGIPIDAPAGSGGLGPNLSLAYSSRGTDGMLGIVQSPEVGLGWSVGGVAQITRKITTHWERGQPSGNTMWEYEADYTLMVNGTSYKLVWGEKQNPGCRYYTEERSGLRVMRYNALCGYETGRPPNETGEYWVVTTPDGTQYRFGYGENSEQTVRMAEYDPGTCSLEKCEWRYWHRFGGYAGDLDDRVANGWSVDQVQDRHGNRMVYQYLEEAHTDSRGRRFGDRAAYLAAVLYGGNYDEDGAMRTPMRYRVEFELESRNGHDDGPAPQHLHSYSQWQSLRVRAIRVCVGVCSGSNVIREYVLRYETPTLEWPGCEWIHHDYPPEVTLLAAVQEYGRGGKAGGAALPPIQMRYVYYDQADKHVDPADKGPFGGKLRYPRLARVDNGYGGWVTFGYERLESDHIYSYRVTGQWQGDDRGRVAWTLYSYGGACFAGERAHCRRNRPDNRALIGHDWAEERAYDYGGALLSRIRHYFHNDKNQNLALGREYRAEVYAPDNNLLQWTENTWVGIPDDGVKERYAIELQATQVCQGDACTGAAYTYDQYGNPVVEQQRGDGNTAADDRTTQRTYAYNTADWLVSLPISETLSEDRTGKAVARQYLYYDGQPHGLAPVKGDLTRTEAWELGGPYTTTYEYDDWGNTTVVTDALGHRATMAYDATYRQFPVQACSPSIPGTGQLCSTSEYYGVNASGECIADGYSFGAVCRAYGPNGPATAVCTRYDPFGRVTAVARPGDTLDAPTVAYDYALVTERVFYDNFETSCDSGGGLSSQWGKWRLTIGCSREAYDGTWSGYLYGPKPPATGDLAPGAMIWNPKVPLQPGGSYRVRLALKGKGEIAAVLGGEVFRTRATDNWEVVEGIITAGAEESGFYIAAMRPVKSVEAWVDRIEIDRVRGLRVTETRREESGCAACTHTTVTYYDGLGQAWQVRAEAEGGYRVHSREFDGLGRIVRGYLPRLEPGSGYTTPAGDYTATAYDALGRTVKVVNPDQTYAETRYAGWTTMASDANRHQRVYTNDGFGQLVRVEEYTGTVGSDLALYAATHYGYDALGNLTVVSDTNSITTTMQYDALGRKVAMDDPDMGHWAYGYDLLGNLITQTDALSQTLVFEYDVLNRLTWKGIRDQGIGIRSLAEYRYDESGHGYGIGQRTSMTDPTGVTAWAYDVRGRVVTETRTFTGLGEYATGYTYDNLDRVRTMTYPDPATGPGQVGEVVTQEYDDGGLPDTLASSLGETFVESTRYNPSGQITEMTLGNALQTTYDYDAQTLRLNWMKTGTPAEPGLRQWLAYSYDDVGNVLRIEDQVLGDTQDFTYDPLDRLAAASATGLITATYTRAYGYDEVGNIDWRVNEGQFLDYLYDGPQPHAVTDLGDGSHFKYDGNGNMTLRVEISGTQALTYVQEFDVENRLAAVTATNGITESVTRFGYDGDGARVWQATEEGVTLYVGEYYEEFVPGANVGQDDILSYSAEQEAILSRSVGQDTALPHSEEPDAAEATGDPERAIEPASGSAPTGAAGTLGAYSYTDEFDTLDTNYWQPWTSGGVNLYMDNGALHAQHPSAIATGWNMHAGVRLKELLNFTGSGTSVEWRQTIYPEADWNLIHTGLWDCGADRYLYFDCVVGHRIDPPWTDQFWCDISLRKCSDHSWVYQNKAFTTLDKGTFHTFKMVNSGERRVDFYLDGALIESKAFTPGEWNGIDWVSAEWQAIGWDSNDNGGWPNVIHDSLDRFSFSGSVDNVQPSITLSGQASGAWYNDYNNPITVAASDGESGVKRLCVAWNSIPLPCSGYQQGPITTHAPGAGIHVLNAYVEDWAGNTWAESREYWVDVTLPTGSIIINGGDEWTNDRNVTLTLSAADPTPGSGVTQMRVWNDGQSEPAAWEPYATSKSWTLPDADGTRTVTVRFRDAAGNQSVVYSDQIGLDRQPPTGSIIINGGDEWTNDRNVTLTLSAADPPPGSGVAQMRVWNDGEGEPTAWEPYVTSKPWTLPDADGLPTVYVCFRDAAGNQSVVYSDQIGLDRQPPTGSILVNGGSARTNNPNVILTLSAFDVGGSGAIEMRFHNDGEAWSTWEGYAAARPWTLRDAEGSRTVTVQFRDEAGNTGTYTDAIDLDRVPPPLTVNSPAAGAFLGANRLWIEGEAEPYATIDVQVSPSGAAGQVPLGNASGFSLLLESALRDGANTVTITGTDQALNPAVVVRHLTLDRSEPGVTNSAPQGVIGQAQPTISGDFSEPLDPADVRLLLNGQDATGEASVTAAGFTYTPAAPLEPRQYDVLVELRDAAGNAGGRTWSFTVDLDTWVEIRTPPLVNGSPIAVAVAGETGATVSLSVNGAFIGERTLAAGETIFTAVPLQAGSNTLAAAITDTLGHTDQDETTITLDTARPQPEASADPPAFAPQGRLNTTQFALDGRPPQGGAISSWRLAVIAATGGAPVTATTGTLLPATVVWDGTDSSGQVVAGGAYSFTLVVTASNGLAASTPSQAVWVLDGPPPAPQITTPSGPLTTTVSQVWVAGAAQPGSTLALFDTHGYFTDTAAVTAAGQWGLNRPLCGGNNELYAVAENGFGPGPESSRLVVRLLPKPPLYPPLLVLPPTARAGQSVTFRAAARDDNPAEGRPTALVTATVHTTALRLTRVSGGAISTWEASWPVTGLNDGDYRARFVGVDEEGFVGSGETTLRVQSPPPPPQLAYPTEPVTRSSASLALTGWAQRFTTLRLYDNGSLAAARDLGAVGDWSVLLTLAEGSHTITATATDGLGQTSPHATAGLVTVDTRPPAASLEPLPPYHAQANLTLRWSGSDPTPGTGVTGYDVQHRPESGSWQPYLAGTTLSQITASCAEGAHAFRVRARDGAHNEGAYSAAVSTVVDLTDPTLALTLSASDPRAYAGGDAVYYGPATGSFTVTATAADATAGLDEIAFPATVGAGGTYPQSGAHQATAAHIYAFDAGDTFQGEVQVQATDRAGRTAAASFTLVRDATPPQAWLSVPPLVYTDTITVAWGASDAQAGLAWYDLDVSQDGGPWQRVLTHTTSTTYQVTSLPGDTFAFRLTATDNVGNAASAEAQAAVPRVTKYYYHGGKRVAMRAAGVVYYLHGDHLGSTSLTTCGSPDGCGETLYGGAVARQLYHPYGTVRYTQGTLPTDFGFTGQRHDGTGLVFMHARYYHSGLGRFVSADTVVPNPGNPQDLNRYAYTRNNPLKYVDPTGYFTEDALREYLKGIYGSQQTEDTKELVWELVLRSWKSNEALWNLLNEAEAGNMLMYTDSNDQVCFGRFLGGGTSKLSGIEGIPIPNLEKVSGAGDMGLPDVLQNDIVGLFSYDHAHLRLKYSGTGLGEWAVSTGQIDDWEIVTAKGLFFGLPTFLLAGPPAAAEAGVVLTTEQWLLQGAGGVVKSSFVSWLGGRVLGQLGYKSGNDVITGSNGFDSLSVKVDRGVVHWSSGVTRWDWQGLP